MSNNRHYINKEWLTTQQLKNIFESGCELSLAEDTKANISNCRNYLDELMRNSEELIYGINTGFGALCDIRITGDTLEELQHNLVRSHAAGVGREVPQDIVQLMLLLKVQSLSYGHSGADVKTLQRLIDMYNNRVLPVVYEIGSLGASGDLAPLAHLSLPLIGEGEVNYQGKRYKAAEVLKLLGWEPLQLQSKEGLALLNGTQFCCAYSLWCLWHSQRLYNWANATVALSIDGFNARISPFREQLHRIRPHATQANAAAHIRQWLKGSRINLLPKQSVQDPYAFRCTPQVHGASAAAILHAKEVIETEVNSVTDNPNIFSEEDMIISGGNFHAQPLALVLDYMAIAMAELGSISERRTFQLLSGRRGLPPFLAVSPGLQSGLMISQYTAAALASQNKQLCTPASVDSIVSSNGQEDHVSMGANAATKLYRVVENTERLLAIEWMTAAQAVSMRKPIISSPKLDKLLNDYRKLVPELIHDRVLSIDIQASVEFIRNQKLEIKSFG